MHVANTEDIAQVCHQANKAFCETLGDFSQVDWAQAPEWQRSSAMQGVAVAQRLLMMGFNEAEIGRELNKSWAEQKYAEGWTYGPVKDADKKTHPCLVPYNELPAEQRRKDFIFAANVKAMSAIII